MTLELKSPIFKNNGYIPEKFGYKKENINPPLVISGVPSGTRELILIMDDPDAKPVAGKVWDHWVVWGIDPEIREIPENWKPKNASFGETDYGETRYGGPNPPDKEHKYRFMLIAVDKELDLEEGSTKKEVLESVEGHIINKAMLFGFFKPI